MNLTSRLPFYKIRLRGALELAGCFIHRDEFEKAAELILPAMNHSASTDSARQRAVKLRNIIAERMGGIDLEKMMEDTIEESLARYSG